MAAGLGGAERISRETIFWLEHLNSLLFLPSAQIGCLGRGLGGGKTPKGDWGGTDFEAADLQKACNRSLADRGEMRHFEIQKSGFCEILKRVVPKVAKNQ